MANYGIQNADKVGEGIGCIELRAGKVLSKDADNFPPQTIGACGDNEFSSSHCLLFSATLLTADADEVELDHAGQVGGLGPGQIAAVDLRWIRL